MSSVQRLASSVVNDGLCEEESLLVNMLIDIYFCPLFSANIYRLKNKHILLFREMFFAILMFSTKTAYFVISWQHSTQYYVHLNIVQ